MSEREQETRSITRDRYVTSSYSELQELNRNPIFAYEDSPLLPLEKTLEELVSIIPDVMDHVEIAKTNCKLAADQLTRDESAAIYLYSMSSPIYCHLNNALRAEDRDALKPWFTFLKLFTTALKKLPSIKQLVWRGINCDDTLSFVDDTVRIWWSVNSCSKGIDIVRPFIGDKGTLFAIEAINGKDISIFSANQDEEEIVLMPGSRVRRKARSFSVSDSIFILHLEEVDSQSETQLDSNYLVEAVKQNYLKHSRIERLMNPAKTFPIEQSYINLSIVTVKEQYRKELQLQSSQHTETVLSSYEEIYGAKSAINVKDIFQTCEGENKQVLVLGRAGIGKSTFCRYIAYQWAKGTYWSQYQLLALIPLRRLTADRYPQLAPGQKYSLIDLIKKAVFSYELSDKEEKLLEKQFDPKKTLWILDGYDEIIQNVPSHLECLFEHLLHTQHHIITSRPYMNTLSYKVKIEITGFTDENIIQYVQQFFSQMEEDVDDVMMKTQTLTKFLKSNPSIWGVAHIPVNLELICSLSSNQDWSETQQLSLTGLYTMMTVWICRRYLKTQSNTILQLSEDGIYQRCQNELNLLENLAFLAMKNNTIMIRSSLLKKSLKKANISTIEHPDILNIGILKSFSKQGVGTVIEMDKDHYFVHLSFQEYFAARYVMNTLNGSSTKEAIEFIQSQKYNQRYALVFVFLAGLLSENEEPKCLNLFWDNILNEPLDLVGLRHIELVISCLEETSTESKLNRRNKLVEWIVNCIQRSLLTKNKIILQNLAQSLCRAQSVVCNEKMINMLMALLQDNGKSVKIEVLFFICSLSISNAPDHFIHLISTLLTANNAEIKTHACEAIRTMGDRATTTEILNKLVRLLVHKTANVRRAACYTLREMGERIATSETIIKLLNILGNSNFDISMNARLLLDSIAAKITTTEVISKLVNALRDQNVHARYNTRDFILGRADKLATNEMISKLVDLLEDEREDVRLNTFRIFSVMSKKVVTCEVISRLMSKVLSDKNSYVRFFAYCILQNLCEEVLPIEVLTKLLNELKDEQFCVRQNACCALGQLGQKVATPEVISALKSATKDKNENVRTSACEALVKMRQKLEITEIISILSTALQDDQACVRANACQGIVMVYRRIGITESLTMLKEALHDQDPTVRNNACVALQSVHEIAVTTDMTDALMDTTNDTVEAIRANGCKVIAKIGEKVATPELIYKLVSLLRDKSVDVRVAACHALQAMNKKVMTPQVIDELVSLLRDKSADVRATACSTLLAIGEKAAISRVIGELTKVMQDQNVCVRQRVYRALYQWSKNEDVSELFDDLLGALGDDNMNIRYSASSVLQNVIERKTTSVMINKLIAAWKDGRAYIRENVCFLLGCVGEKAAMSEVIETLVNALDDRSSCVREKACSALSRMSDEVVTTEVMGKLVKALSDDECGVRVQATLLLQKMSRRITSDIISKLILPLNGDDLNDSKSAAELIGNSLTSSSMISELGSSKILELCLSKFASICLKNVSEDQLIQLFLTDERSDWLSAILKLTLVRETAVTTSEAKIKIYSRKEPAELSISKLEHQQLVEAFRNQRQEMHLFFHDPLFIIDQS